MTQWSIWGGFMKKNRGQKSRVTIPLSVLSVELEKPELHLLVEVLNWRVLHKVEDKLHGVLIQKGSSLMCAPLRPAEAAY